MTLKSNKVGSLADCQQLDFLPQEANYKAYKLGQKINIFGIFCGWDRFARTFEKCATIYGMQGKRNDRRPEKNRYFSAKTQIFCGWDRFATTFPRRCANLPKQVRKPFRDPVVIAFFLINFGKIVALTTNPSPPPPTNWWGCPPMVQIQNIQALITTHI